MSENITPLLMPRWGVDMTEGKVVRWLVDEGAAVHANTELVEVESEKAVAPVEAGAAGVLRRLIAPEGVMVPVGGLLGVLAPNGVAEAEIEAFVQAFAAPKQSRTATSSQDETVTALGQSLRLLSLGAGDPPILLVHGFGGDRRGWSLVQSELARQRRVISVDLPGHGDSSKTLASASPEFFRDILLALMDALGLARVHLVGHSWGGVLAIAVAEQAPQRVASLTLIGTAGQETPVEASYIRDFLDASRRTEVKAVLQRLFADPAMVSREMVEQVLRFKRIEAADDALRKIAAMSHEASRQSGSPSAPSVPTQIIAGREDRICPLGENFTPPQGVALHLLDRVGHMPHLEAPAKVASLINAHISTASAP